MSRHHAKSKTLRDAEIVAVLEACEHLHHAITSPRIVPSCDHYRALRKLGSAMMDAVKDLTGEDTLPWTGTSTTPSRWDRGQKW